MLYINDFILNVLNYFSIIANISSCFNMIYSTPSYFISLPEYLENNTISPTLTSILISLPSSTFPGPTATTSASCGFSFEAPERTIPLFVFLLLLIF